MMYRLTGSFALLVLLFSACQPSVQEVTVDSLFTEMPASHTGVTFNNRLDYNRKFNIYTYRNFYNGGGVAIGDVNNDGLVDLYFTANMQENRLYLNKGDLKFEDITDKAGIKGEKAWATGVSMADVNGDGLLDIYVCNSGDIEGDNKQNELFINNGDLTFTESAEAYGLADRGYSTHAAFFDYDKDGDLDLYLLNNSYQAIGSFNLRKNERPRRDSVGGDKLFRNDGDRFVDVSEAAGIYGSLIGFGLGVTVGDVNRDSWPDVYVSNDFFERDYLYINQQDGTFEEVLEEQMRSISAASMGADMADINNDGHPDIFVTDMLPEPDQRLKTVTTFESWEKYQYNVQNGYYHQFIRNMLHLNNADGSFTEIGRLAGVEATDWSWGALIFDMDNDGWKDIFVANGIYQDLTDQDYLMFISNEQTMKSIVSEEEGVDYKTLIDSIPSRRVPNYAFHNQGGITFENKAAEWGLDRPSHSNGSAYGDLDNDGDLDLVVNNVNMEAFIYRNESDTLLADHRYLKFELTGEGMNSFAFGARIEIHHQGQHFYQEQMPVRGFQSTMDPRPHIGLNGLDKVDTVLVIWPNDHQTLMTDVATNQTLALAQSEANIAPKPTLQELSKPLFTELDTKGKFELTHEENLFVDFNNDRLIYHMVSSEGPKASKGDVNGDGREDIYVGGAKDRPGALLLQQGSGFRVNQTGDWANESGSEDLGSTMFDADGDSDLDLYVCSGGNEFSTSSSDLFDRLYLNDGRGNFTKSPQVLPAGKFESTSVVRAADYDGDGDQDLFVGNRLRPMLYGVPVNGYILNNDGKGTFTNVTPQIAPAMLELGMITDAQWADIDGDQDLDVIIVGEWMAVEVFRNEGGNFSRVTETSGLAQSQGWWSDLEVADLDNDGDMDLIIGNHGLNSRFSASAESPIFLYINDFDGNGRAEQVMCRYEGGKLLPFARHPDLMMQLPILKKKYLRTSAYADDALEDIFSAEQIASSLVLQAQVMTSSVAINKGDGTFELRAMPLPAQVSPVFASLVDDFDADGNLDILLGGNLHRVKPEVGRYDANFGVMLKGDGQGGFRSIPNKESGIHLKGEVRDLLLIEQDGRKMGFCSKEQ